MNISSVRPYDVNFSGGKLYLPYEKVAHTIQSDVKHQIETAEKIYGKNLVFEDIMEKIYSKGVKLFKELGLRV